MGSFSSTELNSEYSQVYSGFVGSRLEVGERTRQGGYTQHTTQVDYPVPVLDLRLSCICMAVGVCCFLHEA